MSKLKPYISVTAMAKMIGLSRARFYQLLEEGFLPQPVYSLHSKRPLYTDKLQQQCLEVKEKNIGINGVPIIFYSPRKNRNTENPDKKRRNKVSPLHIELVENLKALGVNVTVKKLTVVIDELYPNGMDGLDQGEVLGEIFRKLKESDV